MMPRKRGERAAKTEETEWQDWWRLRDELGKRLGKRDATGEIDPSLLREDRRASAKRVRRR